MTKVRLRFDKRSRRFHVVALDGLTLATFRHERDAIAHAQAVAAEPVLTAEDIAACDNLDMASQADKLRAILADLGLSQREAARVLEVQEGTFRGWCSGKGKIPAVVWLALEALAMRRAKGPP